MPLFESQELRNKRILDQTTKRLINRVYEAVDDRYYCNVYCAWFAGATFLAHPLITRVDCIKKLWGKGDEQKVIPLYEVCVYPMMSIWFRHVEERKEIPENVKLQGKKNAISNVLDLIGSYSEEKVRDFLNLDTQYNYEQDFAEVRKNTGEEGISTWYATLLIARMKEAWGFQRIIQWDRQVFPIKESNDYSFTRWASLTDIVEPTNIGIKDILFLTTLWIPQAGIAMFDYFDTINK